MVRRLPSVFGSFSYWVPPSRLMARFTVTVQSPMSDQRRPQISPRRMPVVSASSTASPRGEGSAARASFSMRVRSSRSRTFIFLRVILGGLQKSQGFLVMRSSATAYFIA